MEPSRARVWTRRLIRVCFVLLLAVAAPYAVIGWQHMALGDAFLLDYTVRTSTDIPPYTVLVSVVDALGRPARGQIHLDNWSGGATESLDKAGGATVNLGERVVEDIEFGSDLHAGGGRSALPVWAKFLRHGGFSVGQGVRLDIRLRWTQAW